MPRARRSVALAAVSAGRSWRPPGSLPAPRRSPRPVLRPPRRRCASPTPRRAPSSLPTASRPPSSGPTRRRRVDRWNVVVRDDTGGRRGRRRRSTRRAGGRRRTTGSASSSAAPSATPRSSSPAVDQTNPATTLSSARVHVRTSKDPVGDALFYREVPLPFLTAVQDPSRIRWRLRHHRHAGRPADRPAEPARVRELPLLRRQRQRARARRRLRQRQGRVRDHAGRRSTW